MLDWMKKRLLELADEIMESADGGSAPSAAGAPEGGIRLRAPEDPPPAETADRQSRAENGIAERLEPKRYDSVWAEADPETSLSSPLPEDRAGWLADAELKFRLFQSLKPGDWVEWSDRGTREFSLFLGRLPCSPGYMALASPGCAADVHFLFLVRRLDAEKQMRACKSPLQ